MTDCDEQLQLLRFENHNLQATLKEMTEVLRRSVVNCPDCGGHGWIDDGGNPHWIRRHSELRCMTCEQARRLVGGCIDCGDNNEIAR